MESCLTHGSRGISEYARSAACRPAESWNGYRREAELENYIQKLRNRVEELDQMVRHLTWVLDPSRALGSASAQEAPMEAFNEHHR